MNGRTLATGQKVRNNYGKIRTFLPLPNLIDVQRKSYVDFLQMDLLPEERQDVGLQAVFKSVFPFSDFRETCALEFVSYRIGDWKSRSAASRAFRTSGSPASTAARPSGSRTRARTSSNAAHAATRTRTR